MTRERKAAVCNFTIAIANGMNIAGIAPVLGLASERYTQYGTSVIQLLQTIPFALLIVGSLLMGVLTTRFSKKTIAQAGILVIGACGVLPFFFDNFYVLLVTRILIGFGFGLTGPINNAIMTEFFDPERRVRIMGLNVVGMGVGAIVCNLLGGLLAGAGFRFFFIIYIMAFGLFAIVQILLPKTPPARKKKASELKVTKEIYILAAVAFLFTLFNNAYGTNISMHIAQSIAGNAEISGIATAINAASAMCMGILFSKVVKKLKKATLPFGVFAAGGGFLLVLLFPGLAGILLVSSLCGIAQSCFNAMSGYLVSVSVEPDAVAKASGIFSIISSLGGLIAPLVLGSLSGIFGGNTPHSQFLLAMAGMMCLGVALSFYLRKLVIE